MKDFKEIKTFEDACTVLALNPEEALPDFKHSTNPDVKALEAHAKLVIIAIAVNKLANKGEEWFPNWNDYNERKYYPWFDLESYEEDKKRGSSGFRYGAYDTWRARSDVGSRLCFINEEVCKHVVDQFIDLYKDYFVK